MKKSKGEESLAILLRHHGISFIREVRFHKVRRWRFDFVICAIKKIAVEVEGGTFSGGRHTRPMGYAKDLEKYNTATLMGWSVLRYTTAQIDNQAIKEIRGLYDTKK